MTDVWYDLSGAELRARLRQRGVRPRRAEVLVQFRSHPETARVISHYLSGEHRRLCPKEPPWPRS